MRWLVTVSANEDLASMRERLRGLGAAAADEDPTPLGPLEAALLVLGPPELPAILAGEPRVLGVYPDSDIQLQASPESGELGAGGSREKESPGAAGSEEEDQWP